MMFDCFSDPDTWAQARVGPGLAMPLALSYLLAALQRIPYLHSTFDGDGTSLQHLSIGFAWCS